MFDVCFDPCKFARQLVACLCCMCCCGPILLILGIVMIITPTNRPEKVKEFNQVVDSWNNGGYNAWVAATPAGYSYNDGNVTRDLTRIDTSDSFDGGSDVHQPNGYLRFNTSDVDSIRIASAVNVGDLHVTLLHKNSNITMQIPSGIQMQTTQTISMSESSSTRNREVCEQAPRFGRCSPSQSCTNCVTNFYLHEVCVVVIGDGSKLSSKYGGCYFRNGVLQPALYLTFFKPSLRISVRTENDPYIAAQRISEGTMNFGLTKGQKAAIGVTLIVIGLITLIPLCCICLAIFMCTQRRQRVWGKVRNGNGWEPYGMVPVTGVPVVMQYPMAFAAAHTNSRTTHTENYYGQPQHSPYSGNRSQFSNIEKSEYDDEVVEEDEDSYDRHPRRSGKRARFEDE